MIYPDIPDFIKLCHHQTPPPSNSLSELDISQDFQDWFLSEQMLALNLAQLPNLLGNNQNVATGRSLLATHFNRPNPLPPPVAAHVSLAIVCNLTTLLPVTDLIVNNYLALPARIDGPPPTIDNLLIPGNFQFVVFRVTAVSNASITLRRITLLHDDDSAAVIGANATTTYGPADANLYFDIPAAVVGQPQAPILFMVAVQGLHDQLRGLDPHFAQPAPNAGVPAPAGQPAAPPQPDPFLAQIIQGQAHAAAAAKETEKKAYGFQRYKQLHHIHDEGKYNTSLLKFMQFGVPTGQLPAIGYFSPIHAIHACRQIFDAYSDQLPSRTVIISDRDLEAFILLDFNNNKASFMHLSVPEDSPITFPTLLPFINRACEVYAMIYGASLAEQINLSFIQLRDMQSRNVLPSLTPADCISLVQKRLANIHLYPAFNASIAFGGDLKEHLSAYLSFEHTHIDVIQTINAKMVVAAPVPAPPNPRPKRSITPAAAGGPTTRAKTAASAAPTTTLSGWYKELFTKVPTLENAKLPCFHWLANKPPCLQLATCQKRGKHKCEHSIDPVVVAPHIDVIKTWLKDDPLNRF